MESFQLKRNESLKSFNTFGIDESCDWFTTVYEIKELKEVLLWADAQALPSLILGGGSNLLITRQYEGLVVRIGCLGKTVITETESEIVLRVSAGESWNELVQYTLSNGWFGLENLSLIPGNVGAAPMQNIGAYGSEVKHFIEKVEYLDKKDKEVRSLSADECRFGYRESIFKHELKNQAVIWSVTFRLSKVPMIKIEYGDIRKQLAEWSVTNPTPLDVSKAVSYIRRTKLPDPARVGNAGSFFKNPVILKADYDSLKITYPDIPHYVVDDLQVKVPAGWLIEKAGWKGRKMGNCGVHEKQALVLVNYGQASGLEIQDLSIKIKEDIKSRFGILLQTEVNIL